MPKFTVQNFAQTLVTLGCEKNSLARYLEELKESMARLNDIPGALARLIDPGLTARKKARLLEALMGSVTSQEMRNFMVLLAKRGMIDRVSEIIEKAIIAEKNDKNVSEVVVESVLPLTLPQTHRVKAIIAKYVGKREQHFVAKENKDLIGGLRITIDGKMVIDGSVIGNRLHFIREPRIM